MAVFSLEKLLVLQERDSQRLAFEQQLNGVPREIAAVEAKIAAERTAIEAAKAEWHGLESKKKLLEIEIKSAEEKIGKYKTQQSQVRKNDEYQALTHEIETTEQGIGKLEEQEIGVMLLSDEAKQRFAAAESEAARAVAGIFAARAGLITNRITSSFTPKAKTWPVKFPCCTARPTTRKALGRSMTTLARTTSGATPF